MAEGPAENFDDVFADEQSTIPKVSTKGRPIGPKKTQMMLAGFRDNLARQQEEIDRLRDEQLRREQDVATLRRRSSSISKESELLQSLSEQCRLQREELGRLRQQYEGLSHERQEPRTETRGLAKISVSKFSGTEDLDDYLVQFEAVAQLQRWSTMEKSVILLSKLEGPALSAVNTCKTKTYSDMVSCLKENFSPEQRELSLQKLQSRQQKKGENFSILAADILRLVVKAYPSVDENTKDVIATDHFVNSISNGIVRQKLREKHPNSLSIAIKEARQILADQETESMLVRRSDRAHTIDDSEIERLREQVCQLQSNLNELKPKTNKTQNSEEGKKTQLDERQTRFRRKGPPTCYHCQHKGHIKRWCPFLQNESNPAQPSTVSNPSSKTKLQENLKG